VTLRSISSLTLFQNTDSKSCKRVGKKNKVAGRTAPPTPQQTLAFMHAAVACDGKSASPAVNIIFGHHPLHTRGRNYGRRGAQLREAGLEQCLLDNGVSLYIAGHQHVMQHYRSDGTDPGTQAKSIAGSDAGVMVVEPKLDEPCVDIVVCGASGGCKSKYGGPINPAYGRAMWHDGLMGLGFMSIDVCAVHGVTTTFIRAGANAEEDRIIRVVHSGPPPGETSKET
jgi:hypothetical protein